MSASDLRLNDREFRQALAMLDREQPSPLEQSRFLWLTRSVWSVFFFAAAWILALQWGDFQIVPLVLAMISTVAVVWFFVGSLPLLGKLVRAWRTEWRLGITRYVTALTAKVTSRTGWHARWFRAAPLPVGGVLLLLGGAGIVAFAFPPDIQYLPLPLATFTFGLACLSLYPVTRFNQRLEAVARLRHTLLEPSAHDQGFADNASLNLLVAIERTRILVARDKSAAAVKDGRSRPGRPGSVRLTRQFQASLTLLSPDEIARVYRALRLLLDRLPDRHVSNANADEGRFAVPDTAIALAFTKSSASDDVLVHALYRSGQRLEHPEADAAGEGRQEGRQE